MECIGDGTIGDGTIGDGTIGDTLIMATGIHINSVYGTILSWSDMDITQILELKI
jgi:hypothetical protein